MHFIVIFYHSFYYVTYTKKLTCFTEQFEFDASTALPWAARGIALGRPFPMPNY